MSQAEAPQFVYTEAERADMLTKMKDMAGREVLSAEELSDVGWLIIDRDAPEKYAPEFDGTIDIRDLDKGETFTLGPAVRGEGFNMEIQTVNSTPDEFLILEKDVRGGLRWQLSFLAGRMYPSRFLNKNFEADGDIVEGIAPLSPQEHASVAKRLVDAYQKNNQLI
jgi:hypothetical protein